MKTDWIKLAYQMHTNVLNQIYHRTLPHTSSRVRTQVWKERNQIWDQIWAQIGSQVSNQVKEELE